MNTRTKHTPGPWTHSHHIIGTAEGVICRMASSEGCAGIGRNHTVQTQEANAALIADAPAMLQALRDLYERCAMVHKRWGEDSNQKEADAAIKAGAALIARHTAPATTTADVEKLSATLRAQGVPHSAAQYDESGKCLTCGESERCPGVHTFEEIQASGRAALVCPVDEERCDGCAGVRSPCPDARVQPSADPCKGCLNVGVTNCLSCIDKKEPRT